MSKYHKILIGLMFPIILALAAPGDSTLYQGFESSTYPVWPEGWRRFSLETTTDNYWMRSGSQARTGSACARCLGSAGTRNDDWMILRMIYPTTDSQNLRFYYRAGNSNFRESLEVWVSTTTPDPTGMTVRLAAFGFTTTTYTLRTVNLNGYINQPIYIGIHMVSPSQQSVRIDDVSGPRYPTLDVAPTAITTPSSTYLTTASFTPTAIVKNYGSQSTPSPNFSVACTIYNASGTAVYNTSQNVTPILPNNTRTVSFSATSLLVGNYTMVVRTLLSGDLQGLNNRMVRQLVVTNENEVSYDDGTPALANYYPTVGVGTGLGFGVRYISSSSTTCIIGVEVMLSHDADPPQPANNYFKIRIVDDEGPSGSPGTTLWTSDSIIGIRGQWNYVAIPNIVIPANDSYYIFWLQGENWTQCAGLALDASDNAPSGTQWNYDGTYNLNSTTGDLMIRAIEGTGVTDAQTISILAPTGTVNQGATLNPQAVIRNNSSIAQSIPVRFTISDGYIDDTTVTINASQQITINFVQWTASTPGSFETKCTTRLAGDMNPTNDLQTGSVLVQNIDVQCLSIDDPAGTVNQGTVIAPKATIRNNGNTAQTFDVLFSITGGYSNTQSLTLGPGTSQQVTFTDWTAGPPGTQTTKCTTQLAGDMNTANDLQSGSVFVQHSDIQPILINRPVGAVNQGDTFTPKATVRNNGNTAQSFSVLFTIDDGYSNTQPVNNLGPGATSIVNFALWTANTPGSFPVRCSTGLAGDMNPVNDTLSEMVLVRGYDVQPVVIIQPAGSFNRYDTITPKALIRNNGNTVVTFPILFTIGDGYVSNQSVTMTPGTDTTISFGLWTTNTSGSFPVRCSTGLISDMNTVNDTISGSVFVQNLDVQCLSIDDPTGTINQGTVIAPKATIRNNGNTSQTFNVFFTITGGYSNSQSLTLGPGASQQVTFTDWTAGPPGTQTTKCTTQLVGDMNTTNDEQTGSVLVQSLDAQTVSILAPTGTVNQGTTLNPQAVIKNNGNTSQSVPVRFTISDGYADDTTVALNAGQEITVDFLQWTANTPGNFPVRCSTGLIGDMNVTNDTISGSVFVQNLDVQCLSIDDPAGAVNQGTVIAPKATIRNNGNTSQTFNVLFTITGGCSNTQSLTLGPGASQQVTFADWTAGPLGTLGTKCTTQLVGDMNTTNDQSEGSVLVQSGTSAPSTWQRMADIPTQPSGKNSKAGSCVTGLDDKIYFLKASNTQDFHIYTPDNGIGTWTSNITDTIPIGTKEAGDGKKPKKGASMAAYQTALYVLRGNNTPGFWKFQTDSTGGDTFGWHKLANIPTGAKNPKDASSLIKITKGGIDNIFAMKGSRTDEFYLYDIATNTWTPTPTKPTAGNSGKIGYKKGSYLTYDGNNYVYVLKGSYGDFFLYDLSTETWTELKRYNHKFFINRDGKKKKIGEGSGMVYCDNAVYLLKGGNTREFWKYNISADTWVQMNPSDTWDIPIGDRNKKVKGGGSLILAGDYLYATKGANTPEFYRHTLPTSPSALTPNRPASEGTMGNGLIKDGFKLTISPNPANNITALSYNLSAPGPVNFKLYNVAGVLLKAYTNSSPTKGGIIMIDASTLSSGIYILRFNSGDLKVTRKLVLEK